MLRRLNSFVPARISAASFNSQSPFIGPATLWFSGQAASQAEDHYVSLTAQGGNHATQH
jgi:hypothetical protein